MTEEHLTQDCLDLFGGESRLWLALFVVHDSRYGMRSQAFSLIESTKQVVGQFLGSGACVTPLQKFRSDKLRGGKNDICSNTVAVYVNKFLYIVDRPH